MNTDTLLLAWNPCDPAEARALVSAVRRSAEQHGVPLEDPPTEPDNCCGNDCIECVWAGHYQALAYWRDQAVLTWAD